MPVLKGTTSGSIIGIPYKIPSTIQSISLTNNTAGAGTVAVYIIEFGTNNKVFIANVSLAANASYLSDVPVLISAGFTIYMVASVSTDYYFSLI